MTPKGKHQRGNTKGASMPSQRPLVGRLVFAIPLNNTFELLNMVKMNSPIGELKHQAFSSYKGKARQAKPTTSSTLFSRAYKALKEAKEKVRTKRTTSYQPSMKWVPKH